MLSCMPLRMALNCDASQLAVLDASGALSFYDLTARCHHPVTREVMPMPSRHSKPLAYLSKRAL